MPDSYGSEMEARESARLDADLEMADLYADAARSAARRAAGVCQHGSGVGYHSPPLYPGQVGLKRGQSRCTEGCGVVFDSDEAWYAAMDEAMG